MRMSKTWRIWLTAFGVALLIIVATSLSTFTLYDINIGVAKVEATGPGGKEYRVVLISSEESGGDGSSGGGGGGIPGGGIPPGGSGGLLPYSFVPSKLTDDKVGDIPDITWAIQVPHDPQYLGNLTLHGADGDYIVHAWEVKASLAVTATPRTSGASYDKWARVTLYVLVKSRIGYVFMEAYVRNVSVAGTAPADLASSLGMWVWGGKQDYRNSHPENIAPNANIPTVEDISQYNDLADAMKAYDLSRGVTLVFTVYLEPTIITGVLGDAYGAAVSMVIRFSIVVCHVEKIDPTQPEGREDIESPVVGIKEGQRVPWWAWWSITVLVLIGVILVVVKTIPAAVRAVKARG